MRLALKAQGQCRATVETIATIKNPPVVFAKQVNITSGPQQVNNASRLPLTRTANQETRLEGTQHGGTALDAGATTATTRGYPELETVGALYRPAKHTRKERVSRMEGRLSQAAS
jgi:hypothetical protein